MPALNQPREAVVLCTECGCPQPVVFSARGTVDSCLNCDQRLRFDPDVECPHCGRFFTWSSTIGACPSCGGALADSIPLRPVFRRALGRILSDAIDGNGGEQRGYLRVDVDRRYAELLRHWRAVSRGEEVATAVAHPHSHRREEGGDFGAPKPKLVVAAMAALALVVIAAGVYFWRSATKQAVYDRMAALTAAAQKADAPALEAFYCPVLRNYKQRQNVPRGVVDSDYSRTFRDYPFVIRYKFSEPVFESVSAGEVSVQADREWELRGDEVFSGSERLRLVWARDNGEWRIISEEQLRKYWSRKFRPKAEDSQLASPIGVVP